MGNEKPTENQNQPQEGQPDYASREDLTKFQAETDKIWAILRKERDASAKRIEGLEATLKAATEKLSAFDQPKPITDDGKPDPKVVALEARLKEYEGKLESERKAREQVEQARLTQERRTALSNALVARGISGPHLEAAMAYIYDAKQMVVHDEKGGVGIKMVRSGYEEIAPLDAALEELLKQDTYKIFLPPRQVQGSGTAPGRQAQAHRPDGKMTVQEAAAMLPDMLRNLRSG